MEVDPAPPSPYVVCEEPPASPAATAVPRQPQVSPAALWVASKSPSSPASRVAFSRYAPETSPVSSWEQPPGCEMSEEEPADMPPDREEPAAMLAPDTPEPALQRVGSNGTGPSFWTRHGSSRFHGARFPGGGVGHYGPYPKTFVPVVCPGGPTLVKARRARMKHRRGFAVPMPPSGPPRRNPVRRCGVVSQEVLKFQSTMRRFMAKSIDGHCPTSGPSINISSRSWGDTDASLEICRSVW